MNRDVRRARPDRRGDKIVERGESDEIRFVEGAHACSAQSSRHDQRPTANRQGFAGLQRDPLPDKQAPVAATGFSPTGNQDSTVKSVA